MSLEEQLIASTAVANYRRTKQVMIVKFETNVPQRITLKFAAGREVEGQYGAQYLHSLLPEGQVYFSPVVEEKITNLGIADGETIEVCKREVRGNGGRPRTEWQVSRVGGPAAANDPTPSAFTERHPQDTPIPTKVSADRAMSMYLIAAGRAALEAEQVLNGSVRFDSRDVASMATTMLIHGLREGWVGAIAPTEAQRLVVAGKIQTLTPAKPVAAAVEFKPAAQAWTTRGEMRAVFARLREAVGEVEYAKEMERAGVSDPTEFRYSTPARECYSRLVAIAAQEVA